MHKSAARDGSLSGKLIGNTGGLASLGLYKCAMEASWFAFWRANQRAALATSTLGGGPSGLALGLAFSEIGKNRLATAGLELASAMLTGGGVIGGIINGGALAVTDEVVNARGGWSGGGKGIQGGPPTSGVHPTGSTG